MIALRRLGRLIALLPSTRIGGTERHTAELAARIGARTRMAVDLAATAEVAAALRPRGAALHAAAIGHDATPGCAARQAEETRRLLAALAPDAAFLPLPWPDAGDGILAALSEAGLPRVVLLHLAPAPMPAAAPPSGLGGAALAAVSAPLARRAEQAWALPRGRIAHLPNPAPPAPAGDRAAARAALRQGLGVPQESPLLLFVGRLEEAKGADLLPALSDRLPATLAVLGDGPLRGVLQARAAADPRGLLRPLGPVADPSPWYLAADALLLPSRLEGAPLVFLEAAAHRCPVVATPAALEALGEEAGRHARIAAAPDAPSLADAAAAALSDPSGTAARVEAAAAFAARHGWDGVVEGVSRLLRAAVPLARRAA